MDIHGAAVFADVAASELDRAAAFWTAVTGGSLGTPTGDDREWVPIERAGEDAHLWLQRTGREAGQAGWHHDLFVPDPDAAVRYAADLGARLVHAAGHVRVVSSPGGRVFCLVATDRVRRRPEPVRWPDGHRSLVDQVCLDIPADRYDDEVRFWAALTGWERRFAGHAEFERLVRPDEVPLRILLQRLEDGDTVGAHVDLSCDDRPAEVRRHEELGATTLRPFAGWTVLRDPVGLTYCITDRTPGA